MPGRTFPPIFGVSAGKRRRRKKKNRDNESGRFPASNGQGNPPNSTPFAGLKDLLVSAMSEEKQEPTPPELSQARQNFPQGDRRLNQSFDINKEETKPLSNNNKSKKLDEPNEIPETDLRKMLET